jgi:hypothetical protein
LNRWSPFKDHLQIENLSSLTHAGANLKGTITALKMDIEQKQQRRRQ